MENIAVDNHVVFIDTAEGDFRGMEDNIWVVHEVYSEATGKALIKSLQNPEFLGFLANVDNLRPASRHEIKIGRAVRAHEKEHANTLTLVTALLSKIEAGEVYTMQQVKDELIKIVG